MWLHNIIILWSHMRLMVPNKNQNWVNNTWDKLETILKTTMDEIIPIKSIVKSDQPRRPKLKSETYKMYKWCLCIIRLIKRDDLEKITIGKKHKFIDNLQYIIQNITEIILAFII